MTTFTLPAIGSVVEFATPFDQYADRDGHHVRVVDHIIEADEHRDADALPMVVVLDLHDRHTFEAWPEEVGA